MNRRTLLLGGLGLGAGLVGLRAALGTHAVPFASGFGPLEPDPHGLLELPAGWDYAVISKVGTPMADGFVVPGQPDGMCAFPGPDGLTLLVRNHELDYTHRHLTAYGRGHPPPPSYDLGALGGTTTLVYDGARRTLVREFLSLTGTHRNCAGGPTPWGSWISCEEDVSPRHGYPFEVPASATPNLAPRAPLKAMGRFRREAVAVHAASGSVYQTEDRPDGLLYRFVPRVPGRLAEGGTLQALVIERHPKALTHNRGAGPRFALGERLATGWIDLKDPESPADDLRHRGHRQGAATFDRGEGIWADGDAIYVCSTTGGRAGNGQIWRYDVPSEGKGEGTLTLFAEPDHSDLLENGDNLTMAPWGDLVVCEDGPGWQRLMAVTPGGRYYPIAKNVSGFSELAGVCFAPDGKTLFVNIQEVGVTLAVWGFG